MINFFILLYKKNTNISTMSRICIIGSGLTGAITATLLKQKLPDSKVIILEKARGTGGRFCTSRSSFGNTVDLGAQFITKTSTLSKVQAKCYSELLEAGLLQPLQETVEGLRNDGVAENFICPQGSGSIVKHFLQSAGCEILFGQRVTKLSVQENKWTLLCENKSHFECNVVILTIPVPQVLQIEGINSYIQGKQLEDMQSVQYSSRFALGLFYDHSSSYFDNVPWVAKYVSDDSVVRFCSIDHKKRNSSNFPAVAIHTTKEFGKMHVEEDSSSLKETILSSVMKILPNFPEPSFIKPQKWRYSQVEKSYIDSPGCIMLSKEPLLISGGDGYSCSTFEGCIYSSENIVKNVMENYK